MLRSMLTAVVAAVAVALSGMSAEAGLFNRSANCGTACGACAAPAPVCGGCDTGCGRVKRVKCKRVKVRGCCAPAPSCCAPAVAPACCAPVAPTCCAPAPVASCCAPVAPSCAAPVGVGAPVDVAPAPMQPAPTPPKEGGAQ